MQEDENSAFESYLREFTPRKLNDLPRPALTHQLWQRRFAAAAAVALGLGALLWLGRAHREESAVRYLQEKPAQPADKTGASQLLLLPMTRLALDDPQQLDVRLATTSRVELPNFRKSDSALRVLAKE